MTVDFNPLDPAVIADPYPALAELRERDPVHWSERLGGWVLTRYDDVRMALRDSRFSADRMAPFFARLPEEERAGLRDLADNVTLWAVFVDPPGHTRLRGLMNRAFTSRALEAMRPRIQAIVAELVDAIAAKAELEQDGDEQGGRGQGGMDLIADFAYPLPALVIAEMLGVPRADVALLKRWSDQLGGFIFCARLTPDKYREAAAGMGEMTDYFRRLVAARRRRPGEDVTSALIGAEERGEFLSAEELVAACSLLLFAGHETTTQMIGNGFLALLRHPEQLALLAARRNEASLAQSAVEEMLRWDGPSLAFVRVLAEDVTVGERKLRRGERAFLMIAAANRDARVFADPDRFDVRRQPNPHIAFGYGIHFCLGAPLARMEGQIAFPALLERLADFSLGEPAPRWSDSLVIRGVDRVRLGFRRAA